MVRAHEDALSFDAFGVRDAHHRDLTRTGDRIEARGLEQVGGLVEVAGGDKIPEDLEIEIAVGVGLVELVELLPAILAPIGQIHPLIPDYDSITLRIAWLVFTVRALALFASTA